MKRSTIYLTIAFAMGTFLSASIQAGTTAPEQTIAAGYDLYQLAPEIFLEVSDDVAAGEFRGDFNGPAIGIFDDFEVFGQPLGQFDFGDGPVDVGLADTIVRRDQAATSQGEDGTATVPIEMVALGCSIR
jgi:hypothetical protein